MSNHRTYAAACALICAVDDRDELDTRRVLRGVKRSDLEALAITLAAMVPVDTTATAAMVAARTRYVINPTGADGAPAGMWTALIAAGHVTGVDPRRILTPQRDATSADARHIYYWLRSSADRVPFIAIGRECGRDHSTVMYGVRRVESSSQLRALATLAVQVRETGIAS